TAVPSWWVGSRRRDPTHLATFGDTPVSHCLRAGLLSCTLLAAWLSAHAAPTQGGEVTLHLTVPHSEEFPERNGGYKLLIDGKDYSEPKETKPTPRVPIKEGRDKVTIKYT